MGPNKWDVYDYQGKRILLPAGANLVIGGVDQTSREAEGASVWLDQEETGAVPIEPVSPANPNLVPVNWFTGHAPTVTIATLGLPDNFIAVNPTFFDRATNTETQAARDYIKNAVWVQSNGKAMLTDAEASKLANNRSATVTYSG